MKLAGGHDSPLIDIQHATVYRGSQAVLHDLSFVIEQGCSTVILGPNGSGKSTLMKVFSRELYPVSKEASHVRLLGKEIWNVWELRSQLGMVSADVQQEYLGTTLGLEVVLSGFFASMGTYQQQSISLFQRAKSYEIMETLGVAHLSEHPFQQMSTGEQRRTLLGRALVHEPHTLILDEPTTGLDVQACFRYMEIIRKCIREGKTIILVTHHIHEIPPEVERVVLLQNGRVMMDGPKHDVLTEDNLSVLFDTPVGLVSMKGWFQVFPNGVGSKGCSD